MSDLKEAQGYELINIILPQQGKAKGVLDTLYKCGCRSVMHIGSRGSVLSENSSLLSKMFPPPSPKQDVFQLLVPAAKVSEVMEKVTAEAHLHISGAGGIFSTPCGPVNLSEGFKLWEGSTDGQAYQAPEQKRVGIVCIVERGAADPIAKAAILAGSPGPSVYFAEGRGLRDRVRLLRICKTAEKEIVVVVVEEIDEDLVFQEMSAAGRITEPGRGFIYTIPVSQGLLNLTGTDSGRKQSASMQEIIRAIDEIKGGKAWRGYNPILREATKRSCEDKPVLTDLICVTCVTPRDFNDVIMDSMLHAGAPAASVSHGRIERPVVEGEDTTGLRLNQEWSIAQSIISPNLLDQVREGIRATAKEHTIEDICMYTYDVPKAQTYLGK